MADKPIGFDQKSVERIVKSVLFTERIGRNELDPIKGRSRKGHGFKSVRGIVVANVPADAETFQIEGVESLTQHAPVPADPLTVANTVHRYFAAGAVVYADYNYKIHENANWETVNYPDRHVRYGWCYTTAPAPVYQARTVGGIAAYDIEPGLPLGEAIVYRWGQEFTEDPPFDADGWLLLDATPDEVDVAIVRFASPLSQITAGQAVRLISNTEIQNGLVHGTDGVEIWGEPLTGGGGEQGPPGPAGPTGPTGPEGPQGPPGSGAANLSEGYCIEAVDEGGGVFSVHHDAITSNAGIQAVNVDPTDMQFWIHFKDAAAREDARWQTAKQYDPAAKCQVIVNFGDTDWDWVELQSYDNTKMQFVLQTSGDWDWHTITGYDPDKIQLLGHLDDATWHLKTIAEWLALLEGFVLANNQSLVHDAGLPPVWKDDVIECPP